MILALWWQMMGGEKGCGSESGSWGGQRRRSCRAWERGEEVKSGR